MAWFRCIKDNQYDGVVAYRTGQNYEFPSNPDSNLFSAITDANADRIIVEQKFVPTHKDQQGDHHVHVRLQFENGIVVDGQEAHTITDASGDVVVRTNDRIRALEFSTGTSDITVSLPPCAENIGRVIDIALIEDGGGDVVIDASGSEKIKSDLTLRLTFQWTNATLRSNGTEWVVV